MSTRLIYVTAPSGDEARRLGRALVEERLAACANIIPGIVSIYRWDGAMQEDDEVALILKTQDRLVDRLTKRVRALHPYQCPCVVALPIEGGNPAFLQWIVDETG